MRRLRASPLLVSVLLAAAARGSEPSSALPESLTVPFGASVVLPLPASALFVLSDQPFVDAIRTREGVRLTGRFIGSASLFILDGDASDTVHLTVAVGPGRTTEDPARALAGRSPDGPSDQALRLLTGGWISRGVISVDTVGGAGQGFYSHDLSGSLSGATPALSYQVSGFANQTLGGPRSVELRGDVSGPWGRGSFQPGDRYQTEFRPVLTGAPDRDAFLHVDTEDVQVEAGARAPYRYDRLNFNPDAIRGFAAGNLGRGSLGIGVIGGGFNSFKPEWLPFLSAGVRLQHLSATVFGGMVPGAAAHVFGAEARSGAGRCFVSGRFTTGLRGPDAGSARLALQSYVDANDYALSSRGTCRSGELSFSLGALRGGRGTAYVDSSHLLLQGDVSWRRGETTRLVATGQWSANGKPDLRNFATLIADTQLGSYAFEAILSATHPLAAWNFNELVMARRLFAASSIGVSAGTSHAQGPPDSGWAALDGSVNAGAVRAGASLQTTLQRFAPPAWNGIFNLEWLPFPAYSLRAYSTVDLRQYQRWNVSMAFSYAFGDVLPREPLLSSFRTWSLDAVAFEDLDGDGKWGKGEPPLAGATICLDKDNCGTTDASGKWTAEHLSDGMHRIRADATNVEGAIPTTEAEVIAGVGTFKRTVVRFGFRRSGEIVVRAFFDTNGNGRRDPGEKECIHGSVQVIGPGVDIAVPLGGQARAAYYQKGRYALRLDVLALPPGYAALSQDMIVRADGFRRIVVDVPMRPLRSLSGTACIADARGLCGEKSLPIPLVRVIADGQHASTNERGEYLVLDLPPGLLPVTVAESTLPPGLRLAKAVSVKLSDGPEDRKGVVLPFVVDPFAARKVPVEIEWPGAGRRQVLETGGYFFSAATLASEGKLDDRDRRVLRRLAARARQAEARIQILVFADVRAYVRNQQAALARARELGAMVARLFSRDRVKVEARLPRGDQPTVEVRVFTASTPREPR